MVRSCKNCGGMTKYNEKEKYKGNQIYECWVCGKKYYIENQKVIEYIEKKK